MGKQGVTYEISALDKASKTFRAVEIQSDKTKRSVDNLNNGTKGGGEVATSAWGKTNSVLKNTAVIAGGIVALRFGYSVGKDAIMATAQIEKYNVTLKTMLGSTTAARDRMQEYLDIAKKTPYELYQVVETGNQLQAIGRYSRENLEMLGDLAAASGKPMEQVMNAYAKLATGQKGEAVNMFRDLLISTDDWTKATGKAKAKNGELLATTEQMIKALPKIMQSKGFFGMMAAQAETTKGKLSNAKDAVFTLSDAFGERLKPTTDDAISAFTKWVGITEDWIRIPTAEKIATEKVELNLLVGQLTDANIKGEARKNIIDEIQRKYPEFLKNINIEKATVNELTEALAGANGEYEKKIRLAIYSAKIEKLQEKYKDVSEDIYDAETSVQAKKEVDKLSKEQKAIFAKYGANWQQSGTDEKGVYINVGRKKKYLPKKDSDRVLVIREDMKANESFMNNAGGWWNMDSYVISEKTKKANEYKNRLNALIKLSGIEGKDTSENDSEEKGKVKSPAATVFGDSSSGGSGAAASSVGSGRGGGDAKNVTTHIQNLINGDIVIQTTNLTEGAAEIKRIVIQTLLDATNEIN